MRLLFFVLLLVNVMAFYFYSYQDQTIGQNKPAQPELNAERIRLANSVPNGEKRSSTSETSTCWVWSGFKAETVDQARAALDSLALGDKLTQPAKADFWLYIPPLKNKQEAQKKLLELKSLAVVDGVIMEERGKWRFAISISANPTEEEATVRFNQLKEKGVKTAKILKRDTVGDTLMIKQIDEKTATTLSQLQTQFAETALKQVECIQP